MQPLIQHVEAIQKILQQADHSDLSRLADVHSRFEQLVEITSQTEGLHQEVVNNVSAFGKDARTKLEQLILNEAQDVNAHLQSVHQTVQEIRKLLQNQQQVGLTPAPTPDSFEQPRQEAARSAATEVFPESAHLFNPDDLPLIAEFLSEATGHLETAEQEILKLEEDPGNLDSIGALFRAFHTIKGVAGFLNLNQIQSLAHAAENLLDLGREGKLRVTGSASDIILQSIDLMKRLLAALEQASTHRQPLQPQPGVRELCQRLNQMAEKVAKGELIEDLSVSTERSSKAAGSPIPGSNGEITPPKSPSTTENSVKVATDRLDSLINMVGELVIANSMVAQDVADSLNTNQRLSQHINHLGKIVRDLQDLSMSLRMIPVNAVFRKMSRLVRDVARKAGKEVELIITGADTELDRNVVEALADPLVHMVRNSIDHGIEPPDQRVSLGKPRVGRLELKAYHKGGNINIEICDDGRGLSKEKILRKAIQNGMVGENQTLSDQEIYKLIFEPGLSTAEKVTDISGRGVGMDVVRKNIEALRGRIDIVTEPGKGSTFIIRLPLTLAVIDGLVVKVGKNKYIVPIISIEQSIRPTTQQLCTVQGRGELLNIRNSLIPLVRLNRLFEVESRTDDLTQALVVVVQDADRRICLMVDELLGQEQVVIKSLGEDMGKVQGISGCAVLGDGNVSLILDIPGIVSLAQD
ncbi:MAG: chemotaxis protein CheA [Phycisphaerae bacterium]|jgi:two-component system chemotaxis sensor kinase CheA|nr:MAG: chemotaxis protein CheA [Phycisphaerae bacterium]